MLLALLAAVLRWSAVPWVPEGEALWGGHAVNETCQNRGYARALGPNHASAAGLQPAPTPRTSICPAAAYLGTTALAATATGRRLLRRWAALSQQRRAELCPRYALAVLGVTAMLWCLALDPTLCAMGGPWLGTVPLLFAGSAAGFAAIVLLAASDGEVPAGGGQGGRSKAD